MNLCRNPTAKPIDDPAAYDRFFDDVRIVRAEPSPPFGSLRVGIWRHDVDRALAELKAMGLRS